MNADKKLTNRCLLSIDGSNETKKIPSSTYKIEVAKDLTNEEGELLIEKFSEFVRQYLVNTEL